MTKLKRKPVVKRFDVGPDGKLKPIYVEPFTDGQILTAKDLNEAFNEILRGLV